MPRLPQPTLGSQSCWRPSFRGPFRRALASRGRVSRVPPHATLAGGIVPSPSAGIHRLALLVLVAVSFLLPVERGIAQSIEEEARRIGQELQCPVCEGLSVADSPSQLATQMRGIIREKLAAGESAEQIRQYFVDRYGETVLRVPPRSGFTAVAWIAPYVGLGLALAFLVATVRWRQASSGATDRSAGPDTDATLEPYLQEVDRAYERLHDEVLR